MARISDCSKGWSSASRVWSTRVDSFNFLEEPVPVATAAGTIAAGPGVAPTVLPGVSGWQPALSMHTLRNISSLARSIGVRSLGGAGPAAPAAMGSSPLIAATTVSQSVLLTKTMSRTSRGPPRARFKAPLMSAGTPAQSKAPSRFVTACNSASVGSIASADGRALKERFHPGIWGSPCPPRIWQMPQLVIPVVAERQADLPTFPYEFQSPMRQCFPPIACERSFLTNPPTNSTTPDHHPGNRQSKEDPKSEYPQEDNLTRVPLRWQCLWKVRLRTHATVPHLQTDRCQNQAGGPALSQNGHARLKSQPYHPKELASFVTTTIMSYSTTKKPCERKLWAMVLDRFTICSLLRWLAKCCLVLTMVSCLGSSDSPESLPSPAIQKLQHESSKVSNGNWLFYV